MIFRTMLQTIRNAIIGGLAEGMVIAIVTISFAVFFFPRPPIVRIAPPPPPIIVYSESDSGQLCTCVDDDCTCTIKHHRDAVGVIEKTDPPSYGDIDIAPLGKGISALDEVTTGACSSMVYGNGNDVVIRCDENGPFVIVK